MMKPEGPRKPVAAHGSPNDNTAPGLPANGMVRTDPMSEVEALRDRLIAELEAAIAAAIEAAARDRHRPIAEGRPDGCHRSVGIRGTCRALRPRV